MKRELSIVALPGDGIGNEIFNEARKVLNWINNNSCYKLNITEELIGGSSIDKSGEPLTNNVLEKLRDTDAILLGAVGGPKWEKMDFEKRPFSKVVGIPRGGLPLQWALEPYVTEGDHPWLVVDDVYTTGTSFREFCTNKHTMFAYKWCIFARKPINPNDEVRALFTMPEKTNA